MSYRCNCGQEFEHHQERTMHAATCKVMNKPREFWMTERRNNYGYDYTVYRQEVSGPEIIHVIEYSHVQLLMTKLEIARVLLDRWLTHHRMDCETIGPGICSCGLKQDIALSKALEDDGVAK